MSASPWPILALAALAGGAACSELSQLGGSRVMPVFSGVVLLAVGVYGVLAPSWPLLAGLLLLSSIGAQAAQWWVQGRNRAALALASLWCLSPLVSLAVLHSYYAPSTGYWNPVTPLTLVLIPLWIGDSLAYFIGRSIGKHLLAPKLSPKKTVEGAVANLIGCIVGAMAVGAAISIPVWISACCGAMAGILGQVGDLAESGLKRLAGLKDTGTLLPGHGGILDRIDSLLLAAPLQAVFLVAAWPIHANR